MDNRYYAYDCPALMQDGRFLTNYLPRQTLNQFIRRTNNIETSEDYRHFLQNNGDVIANRERSFLQQANTCGVHGQCVPPKQ
jgi:hypothetical protein